MSSSKSNQKWKYAHLLPNTYFKAILMMHHWLKGYVKKCRQTYLILSGIFKKKPAFDESLVSQYFFLINCHPNAHSIVPSQAGLFHYLNEFIFLMFRNQFRARAIQ